MIAQRPAGEPFGPRQPTAVERQLVRVMRGHDSDRDTRKPGCGEPDQGPIDQMRLDDLCSAYAEQACQPADRGWERPARGRAKRKRLDSKLAHVVLQRSLGPYAADHEPPPLQPARLDQRAKVWVGARIAE